MPTCTCDAQWCLVHESNADAARKRLMRRLSTLAKSVTLAPISHTHNRWEMLTIDGNSAEVRFVNGGLYLRFGDEAADLVGLRKRTSYAWQSVRGLHHHIVNRAEILKKREEKARTDRAARIERERFEAEKLAAKKHAQESLQAAFDALTEELGIGTQAKFYAGEYGTASLSLNVRFTPETARTLLEAGIKSGALNCWRRR